MQAIARGFSFILSKLVAALAWFGQLFVSAFVALWDMGTDLFCWGFDGFLSIAVTAVNQIDVSGVMGQVGYINAVPEQAVQMLGLIGAGEALGIVAAAIAIRFVLQLIPFVRLGS